MRHPLLQQLLLLRHFYNKNIIKNNNNNNNNKSANHLYYSTRTTTTATARAVWGQLQGDILRHPLLRVVVVSIFVAVIIIGVLSNAAVLYAVATIRRSRTVASALIGNLAASDLWHCLICLPIQLHYQLTDRWVFGAIMCRSMFASFAVPLYSSSLTVDCLLTIIFHLSACPL